MESNESILTISLRSLRNEGQYQFMSKIGQVLEQGLTEEMGLDELHGMFKTALDNERAAIEFIKQQAPLVPLHAADSEMKKVFACLVNAVKRYDNAQMHPDKHVAVESVMIVVKHYKKLMYRNLSERYASVENFIKDLRERCAQEITLLEIAPWIAKLETANQAFDKLQLERNEQLERKKQKTNMAQCRTALDAAYRKLHVCLQGLRLKGVVDQEMVGQMNAVIRYHKAAIAIRVGQRKAATAE